jgi:putative heme-binding domain-containing protein
MGPDLTGISKRFSRRDLLTAVIEPSRDVPERYQAQVVATHDGELFTGMIVYEAVDSLILQVSADQTLRIPVDRISSRRRAVASMMPNGLLDRLTDPQVADLFAFLESL